MSGAERALFVTHWENEPDIGNYQRLYFGSDVCQHLMPGEKQLEKALDFCGRKGIPLTLVTPLLNDDGLLSLEKLVSILGGNTEVVINDWGALGAVAAAGMQPVMGRLLVKTTRNAGFGNEYRRDKELWEYAHSFNFSPPPAMRFIQQAGFNRIELENVPHGFDFSTDGRILFSVYHPYVIMHVMRKCTLLYGAGKYPPPGVECPRPCRGKIIKAGLRGNTVFIGGPATFFRNDLPPSLPGNSPIVNRLVVMDDRWPF